jgi:hypothetical protein
VVRLKYLIRECCVGPVGWLNSLRRGQLSTSSVEKDPYTTPRWFEQAFLFNADLARADFLLATKIYHEFREFSSARSWLARAWSCCAFSSWRTLRGSFTCAAAVLQGRSARTPGDFGRVCWSEPAFRWSRAMPQRPRIITTPLALHRSLVREHQQCVCSLLLQRTSPRLLLAAVDRLIRAHRARSLASAAPADD